MAVWLPQAGYCFRFYFYFYSFKVSQISDSWIINCGFLWGIALVTFYHSGITLLQPVVLYSKRDCGYVHLMGVSVFVYGSIFESMPWDLMMKLKKMYFPLTPFFIHFFISPFLVLERISLHTYIRVVSFLTNNGRLNLYPDPFIRLI